MIAADACVAHDTDRNAGEEAAETHTGARSQVHETTAKCTRWRYGLFQWELANSSKVLVAKSKPVVNVFNCVIIVLAKLRRPQLRGKKSRKSHQHALDVHVMQLAASNNLFTL